MQPKHKPQLSAVESWKWMLLGFNLAMIFLMMLDQTIESVAGFLLIGCAYFSTWLISRDLKGAAKMNKS